MGQSAVVKKLWASDLTNYEIALRAGYHCVSAVHYVAKRLGLPKRKRGAKPSRLTAEQRLSQDRGRVTANAPSRQRLAEMRAEVVDPVARVWRCGCGAPSADPAGHPSCRKAGRAA